MSTSEFRGKPEENQKTQQLLLSSSLDLAVHSSGVEKGNRTSNNNDKNGNVGLLQQKRIYSNSTQTIVSVKKYGILIKVITTNFYTPVPIITTKLTVVTNATSNSKQRARYDFQLLSTSILANKNQGFATIYIYIYIVDLQSTLLLLRRPHGYTKS